MGLGRAFSFSSWAFGALILRRGWDAVTGILWFVSLRHNDSVGSQEEDVKSELRRKPVPKLRATTLYRLRRSLAGRDGESPLLCVMGPSASQSFAPVLLSVALYPCFHLRSEVSYQALQWPCERLAESCSCCQHILRAFRKEQHRAYHK